MLALLKILLLTSHRSAKGMLTRRMNDAVKTLEDYSYETGEPMDFHVETLKQHLNELQAARDVVHTAYTNLMSVDVLIMADNL